MKYIVELWKCEAYEFDIPDEDGYSISVDDALEQAFELADDDAYSFMDPVDHAVVWGVEENGNTIKLKEV